MFECLDVGWSDLSELVLLRNLECLNLLLNTGADFNRKDSFGRSVAVIKRIQIQTVCLVSVQWLSSLLMSQLNVKCVCLFQDPAALRCCQLQLPVPVCSGGLRGQCQRLGRAGLHPSALHSRFWHRRKVSGTRKTLDSPCGRIFWLHAQCPLWKSPGQTSFLEMHLQNAQLYCNNSLKFYRDCWNVLLPFCLGSKREKEEIEVTTVWPFYFYFFPQVPGIFTAERCKSRNPGQSGLQCCALRLGIRTSPLLGAGEYLFPIVQDVSK